MKLKVYLLHKAPPVAINTELHAGSFIDHQNDQ